MLTCGSPTNVLEYETEEDKVLFKKLDAFN
jgi:hypothetical protein